jgi:hypothetical protein
VPLKRPRRVHHRNWPTVAYNAVAYNADFSVYACARALQVLAFMSRAHSEGCVPALHGQTRRCILPLHLRSSRS